MGASQGSPRMPPTFPALVEQVALANSVAQRYRDAAGRFMVFTVNGNEDADSLFWRQLVHVNVVIQNARGRVEGPHRLSIKQFSALFRALQDHMTPAEFNQSAAPAGTPGAASTATRKPSLLMPRSTPGGPPIEADPDAKECPICMDAAPDIILPCAHAFCKKCLGAWSGKSDECPLCRQAQGDEDEQWVLAKEPSPAQIGAHLLRFLASLTA